MDEYKTEFYIADTNDGLVNLKDSFANTDEYNAWRKKVEETVLEEFYGGKVTITEFEK